MAHAERAVHLRASCTPASAPCTSMARLCMPVMPGSACLSLNPCAPPLPPLCAAAASVECWGWPLQAHHSGHSSAGTGAGAAERG